MMPVAPEERVTRGVRVLLADDDAEARALLAELLVAFGHDVVAQVASGDEAIERAQDLEPDVVLLDVHMPGRSGIDAAATITDLVPGTSVILFTGDPALTLSDGQVGETAAIAVLPKPTPPPLLDSTVRCAAQRGREMSAARREAEVARQELEERKWVERAKGVLMRRAGVSEEEAFRILRRASQDRSRPMIEVAQAVLDDAADATS
jgi:AmiR/NasT family two-component response regulator